MQRKWIIAATAAGAVFLLIVTSFVLSIIGVSKIGTLSEMPVQDTITVYGQGIVAAEPDIAKITLGYENYAGDPQTAQIDNASNMQQITAALLDAGVKETDICESEFNIYQEYYYYDNADTERSYCVSSTVVVTIRQLDKMPDIISAACNAGANVTYGITYGLADCKNTYTQAFDLALGRAEEKAAEVSGKLESEITGVVQVRECGALQSSGGEYFDYDTAVLAADASAGAASAGNVQITAAVYVTYRLQ